MRRGMFSQTCPIPDVFAAFLVWILQKNSELSMKLVHIALFLCLPACVPTAVVTDYNGDSVTVQSPGRKPSADVVSEASRICSARGAYAEYASSRKVYAPQNLETTYGHLFLCLPDPGRNIPRSYVVPMMPVAAVPAYASPYAGVQGGYFQGARGM